MGMADAVENKTQESLAGTQRTAEENSLLNTFIIPAYPWVTAAPREIFGFLPFVLNKQNRVILMYG
jgi:hypothetical protein